MKPFRFTLEAVGVVRRRQEQKAMEHYGRTLVARRQANEGLDTARRELRAIWEEWRDKVAAGMTAADAAQAQAFHRLLAQKRDECLQAAEAAEQRVNVALQAMLLARQQREIVDKFFERQTARYKRDEARHQQKFLDDLAGRRGHSILAWKPAETPL